MSSPQQASGKAKSKSKKKARGKKSTAAAARAPAKSVPVGGLRAAALRLAQFRCNNFGITDELLLPIGAGIFPAAGAHSRTQPASLDKQFSMRGNSSLFRH